MLDAGIYQKLIGWRDRLAEDVKTEDDLRHRLTQQAQWLATPGRAEEVIQNISAALKLLADSIDVLPKAASEGARTLYDITSALGSAPERFSGLPTGSLNWPVLNEARDVIRTAAEPALSYQVELARTANEYPRVLSLLGALGRLRALTETELGWQQRAREQVLAFEQRAPKRAQAAAYLSAADKVLDSGTADLKQAGEGLAAALGELAPEDASSEAVELRRRALEGWRKLVHKPSEPAVLLECARPATEALQKAGLGRDLADDLTVLNQANRTQTGEAELSGFSQDDDALAQLNGLWAELAPAFAAVSGASSAWDSLKSLVSSYEQRVIRGLTGRLDGLASHAEMACNEGNYEEALRLAGIGLKPGEQARWQASLSAAVERLTEVKQTAGSLKAAREGFEILKRDVGARQLPATLQTIQEVWRRAEAIPQPRDPYVTRCLAGLEAVRAAALACQAEPEPSTGQNHAQVLARLLGLTWSAPEAVKEDWPWLRQQADAWRGKVGQRVVALVEDLAERLRQATETFVAACDQPPTLLVDLCWQARWAWAALALGDPSPERRGRAGVLAEIPAGAVEADRRDAAWESLQAALDGATRKLAGAATRSAFGLALADAFEPQGQVRPAQEMAGRLAEWRTQLARQPEGVVVPRMPEGAVPYPVELPPEEWLAKVIAALDVAASEQRRDPDRFARALDDVMAFIRLWSS